jgi:hypothetical protein
VDGGTLRDDKLRTRPNSQGQGKEKMWRGNRSAALQYRKSSHAAGSYIEWNSD